ncbi:calcium load-activated calcium channel-like protein [Tanacetum coccineum]
MSPLLFASSKYSNGLTIVLISFFTALICEAISYILIYRTSSYKSLKSSIDRVSKKLKTMKTDNPTSKKNIQGKTVAKLPFVPLRIVQKMSHRGLQGEDYTDCSMAFLYFLCSISIRTNLQKFLGFSPPRGSAPGGGLFQIPDAAKTN